MSLLDTASLIVTPNGYKGGVTTGKLYSVKPTDASGDMVVTRNTTATRVNSAGLIESVAINVPRLDYPPLGGCPRILVEPARTNLLTYSNTFSDVSWTYVNCTITANNTTSPDGSVNASKLTSNASNNNFLFKAVTAANGIYTFSCFVKYFDTNTINISLTDFIAGQVFGTFNFTTTTFTSVVTTGAWTNTSTNVITLPNGWFKISIISQKGAGTVVSSRIDTFANGTSVYIYGAQTELGSKATSYIPTTTATVTRNADVISDTGISTLIGQTEGTIYAEINNTLMTSYSTGYVMRIFADANNEVWIRKESATNTYTARWRANSVDVYTQSTIAVLNGNNKIAIAYKTGSSAVYLNGTQIGTSASTGAFSVAPSQIGIGSSSTADFFNDRIELATVFQTRLTNAQLATLTTL